jgi:hypothetical protein
MKKKWQVASGAGRARTLIRLHSHTSLTALAFVTCGDVGWLAPTPYSPLEAAELGTQLRSLRVCTSGGAS